MEIGTVGQGRLGGDGDVGGAGGCARGRAGRRGDVVLGDFAPDGNFVVRRVVAHLAERPVERGDVDLVRRISPDRGAEPPGVIAFGLAAVVPVLGGDGTVQLWLFLDDDLHARP